MRRISALIVLALGLAACAQPELPADHFYRLKVQPPAQGSARLGGILQIDRFSADGVTGARPIAYSRPGQSGELQAYHYHFWTEPPTILLQNKLAAYLRGAELARSVVTPELRIEPDHAINAKIIRFERLMSDPPRAVVEIQISLTERTTEKLIHQGTYWAQEPAKGPAMSATIDALGIAVERVFAKFLKDLRG
ncbi:MAG: ABC-type transport auxiliary lipoprotein family protein [Rhodospirillales bacterium]|jgi:ABC-type uncharacterized transport system auxiliary subunit|nr:ABC-type transport auxiliary lipoprotein family protein [Rhodospirillales bacterium]